MGAARRPMRRAGQNDGKAAPVEKKREYSSALKALFPVFDFS